MQEEVLPEKSEPAGSAICASIAPSTSQRRLPELMSPRRTSHGFFDTASASYDQAWLDYQYEIGLRHHRSKKNRTDGAAAAAIVPYRYLPLLFYPVTATLKPFLANGGHSPEEVDRMHQAWMKSVLLQVALWSQPYVRDGDF